MKVKANIKIQNGIRHFEKTAEFVFSKKIFTILAIVCTLIATISVAVIIVPGFDEFKDVYKYSNEGCEYLKEQIPNIIVDGKTIDFAKLTDETIKYEIDEENQKISLYNDEGHVSVEYKYLKDGIIQIKEVDYVDEVFYKLVVTLIIPAIIAMLALTMYAIGYSAILLVMFVYSVVCVIKDYNDEALIEEDVDNNEEIFEDNDY